MRLETAVRAAALGLLPVVWAAHVLLSAAGDPLGAGFDALLWGLASLLKVALLVCLFRLLLLVHRLLFDSAQRAWRAFVVWALSSSAIVSLLALARPWWAPRLSNDAVKYFHEGAGLRLYPALRESREVWLQAWSNGSVVGSEIAPLLVLCGIQAAVAYRIGRLGWPSVLIASGACVAVLSAYVAWGPWFHLDYDFFHGDVIATALLLALPPVLASGYTTLALPLYVAFGLAQLAILRSDGARGAEPPAELRESVGSRR